MIFVVVEMILKYNYKIFYIENIFQFLTEK